ncbi:unnamed protein product [Blepharisma stoltei]|uniref:Uncharacterized protein n=1 Tax=Blepharisma stoltei TaxID=1481888 RepID=A0AAU9KFA3_9CILI|nr:unnamed protein product [Blepharisma stoltei]
MYCNQWNNFAPLEPAKSYNEIADEEFCKTEILACLSHSSTNDDISSPIPSLESNDAESTCCINWKVSKNSEYYVYKLKMI